jgi:hypothetical protein
MTITHAHTCTTRACVSVLSAEFACDGVRQHATHGAQWRWERVPRLDHGLIG